MWVLDVTQNQWQHQDLQDRKHDSQDRKPDSQDTAHDQQSTQPAVEESVVATEDDSDQLHTTCPLEPIVRCEPTVAEDDVVNFIGVLRNCLCDMSNARGDVLCGAAAMRVEHDNADVAASTVAEVASQSGPLGDA